MLRKSMSDQLESICRFPALIKTYPQESQWFINALALFLFRGFRIWYHSRLETLIGSEVEVEKVHCGPLYTVLTWPKLDHFL